jgi:L-threonylcarbamoyladenylate synthase
MAEGVSLSDCPVDMIKRAAALIRNGGVVAFPTETYYGLAVDSFNEKALHRLYALKQRPSCKPILTLINTPEQLHLLARAVPGQYRILMGHFWPGPLTLIFPANKNVSAILAGGTDTVGVRISSNPVAQLLVETYGRPITATSANLSGFRPASSPAEVRQQFGDQLDMVLDGGPTPGGCGSTIVGIVGGVLAVVRQGVIPGEAIIDVARPPG